MPLVMRRSPKPLPMPQIKHRRPPMWQGSTWAQCLTFRSRRWPSSTRWRERSARLRDRRRVDRKLGDRLGTWGQRYWCHSRSIPRIGDRHNHLGHRLAKPDEKPELDQGRRWLVIGPRMPGPCNTGSLRGLARSSGVPDFGGRQEPPSPCQSRARVANGVFSMLVVLAVWLRKRSFRWFWIPLAMVPYILAHCSSRVLPLGCSRTEPHVLREPN